MKSFLLMLFVISVFAVPVPASSISVHSDGTVGIRGEGSTMMFSRGGMLIRMPSFAFGAMEKGGIIYALDHPYSSVSLAPSFSIASSASDAIGACLYSGDLALYTFYGERGGAGVSYSPALWSLFFLASGEGKNSEYLVNPLKRTDRNTLWGGGSYNGKLFSLKIVSSFSGSGAFSALFISSLKLSFLRISYGKGRIQSFSTDGDDWENYLAAEIEDRRFHVSHELRYSRAPVYLNEYRDYEYRIRAKLRIGDFILSDRVTKSFLSGKTKREEKTELSWNGLKIGFSHPEISFYAAISRKDADVMYEGGRLRVNIQKTLLMGSASFTFRLSSSGTSLWIYTYRY